MSFMSSSVITSASGDLTLIISSVLDSPSLNFLDLSMYSMISLNPNLAPALTMSLIPRSTTAAFGSVARMSLSIAEGSADFPLRAWKIGSAATINLLFLPTLTIVSISDSTLSVWASSINTIESSKVLPLR